MPSELFTLIFSTGSDAKSGEDGGMGTFSCFICRGRR
jgi:hypothetical protein